jgi:hypothetical protein
MSSECICPFSFSLLCLLIYAEVIDLQYMLLRPFYLIFSEKSENVECSQLAYRITLWYSYVDWVLGYWTYICAYLVISLTLLHFFFVTTACPWTFSISYFLSHWTIEPCRYLPINGQDCLGQRKGKIRQLTGLKIAIELCWRPKSSESPSCMTSISSANLSYMLMIQ